MCLLSVQRSKVRFLGATLFHHCLRLSHMFYAFPRQHLPRLQLDPLINLLWLPPAVDVIIVDTQGEIVEMEKNVFTMNVQTML